MRMPEISVVIPTYNTGELILEALNSVFEQSFSDYEIVVIDDGSTDGTRDILDPFINKIEYFYQENQGLAVARNTGLSKARGKYITYLDADDVWFPDNLALKYKLLEDDPDLAGIFSEFTMFDENGIINLNATKELFPFFARTGFDYPDIFEKHKKCSNNKGGSFDFYYGRIFDKLFYGNFILPTSMLFRREFTENVGSFVPHMRTQQDYEYWLRFSQKYPFGFIDYPLVKYRRHSKQLTDYTKIERIFNAVLEIINKYEEHFSVQGKVVVFNKRKAKLLSDFATFYIRNQNPGKARTMLRESIRLDKAGVASYIHFLVSFMPIHRLMSIKKHLSFSQNEK